MSYSLSLSLSLCMCVFLSQIEDDVDKLYQILCKKLLKLAKVIIRKKSFCSHNREWWNEEIEDLI